MKPIFLVPLVFFICISTFAQNKRLDSLKSLVNDKEDTSTVWLLKKIGDLSDSNPDSAYRYYQRGLQVAKKLNFSAGQWSLKINLAELLFRTGNYPQALKISFEALKLAEELNDTLKIYWSMRGVTMTYGYMGNEPEQVKKYADKTRDIVYSGFFKDKPSIDFYYLLGYVNQVIDYFNQKKQLDSALYYAQRSYEISSEFPGDSSIFGLNLALGNLANINEKLGNHDLALTYYRTNIDLSIKAQRFDILAGVKVSIAEILRNRRQNDSALYYAREALHDADNTTDPSTRVSVYSLLSELYKDQNKFDSSYKYLNLYVNLKDSLYSQDKLKDIQSQSFAETLRQQEIAEQKAKEKEERKQNLQMIAIGVFIITFFVFVLLLSRSRKNITAISFLAVVALLMVFEFIAMLAHPYIEEWTHHNPVLMLLILVTIASILVPLHHKLEEWMKHKLVRNKAASVDELQEQTVPVK